MKSPNNNNNNFVHILCNDEHVKQQYTASTVIVKLYYTHLSSHKFWICVMILLNYYTSGKYNSSFRYFLHIVQILHSQKNQYGNLPFLTNVKDKEEPWNNHTSVCVRVCIRQQLREQHHLLQQTSYINSIFVLLSASKTSSIQKHIATSQHCSC